MMKRILHHSNMLNSQNKNNITYNIMLGMGWITSLGFKVNPKPNIQIATRDADHQCK